MPGWPEYNKKAAENVVCWTCEHFQRYETPPPGLATLNCQGECRKGPPPIEDGEQYNFTFASGGEVSAFFPFLPFANITWCSGYQRSLEADIPDVTPLRTNCIAQNWSNWTTPWDLDNAPYPRKKTQEETCWYCEHFQSSTDPPNPNCQGHCMLRPPFDYLNENVIIGGGTNRMGFARTPPLIKYSAWKWCSKWERSRTAVPAPPESGGVICAPPS